MIEIRCDKCGNCIGVVEICEHGLDWATINECHCPRCHPENVKEDSDNAIN